MSVAKGKNGAEENLSATKRNILYMHDNSVCVMVMKNNQSFNP